MVGIRRRPQSAIAEQGAPSQSPLTSMHERKHVAGSQPLGWDSRRVRGSAITRKESAKCFRYGAPIRIRSERLESTETQVPGASGRHKAKVSPRRVGWMDVAATGPSSCRARPPDFHATPPKLNFGGLPLAGLRAHVSERDPCTLAHSWRGTPLNKLCQAR